MNVLITGGYGNLGSWLVEAFAGAGHSVTVLSRSKKDFLNHIPHQFIECDITNAQSCQQVAGQGFNCIIHAASQNDYFIEDYARKALEINTLGTRNLLEAIKNEPSCRFLYFSTFHVYGAAGGSINEESPTRPRNDYASTHLFAEHYVRQFHATSGVPFEIIRLTNSYGCPLDRNTSKWYLVLNDLAKMAVEKQAIVLNSNGKAQRDFIWMGDVCNALLQLAQLPESTNSTYNLGSQHTYQVLEIAQAVQRAYQQRYNKELPIQVNEADTNPYDKVLQVDSSKLASIVALQPQERFAEEAEKIMELLEVQQG